MQFTRYLPQGTLTYPVKYSRHGDDAKVTQVEEGDVLTVKRKERQTTVPDPPPMTAVTSRYFGHDTFFAGLVYSGQRKVSTMAHDSIADMKPSMPTPIVMGIANWLNKGEAVRAFDLLIPGPINANSASSWQPSDAKVTLRSVSPMLWRDDNELRQIAAVPELRRLFEQENVAKMPWSMIPTWYMYFVAGVDKAGIQALFAGQPCASERATEALWLATATEAEVKEAYERMWRQIDCKALTDAAPKVYCKTLVRQ